MTMTRETYDVIVVGAGMVGAACTLALAEAGLRVIVVDSGPVGGGTTSKGMGHVCVTPEHPALMSLTAYSRRLWQRIVSGMSEDTDALACGTMWLAPDDRGVAALEVRRERLRDAEVHAEWIEARVLRRMEPNLGAMVVRALHVPADLAVTPARAARALIDAALSRTSSGGGGGGEGAGGGRLMSGFEVEAVTPGEVRLATGQVLRAPAIVVAGGYLSGRLVPGVWIRPRKGHIVAAEAEHSYCFHQLIEVDYLTHAHESDAESVAFNVQPRPSGVGGGGGSGGGGSGGGGQGGGGGGVWIGSSRQYDFSTPEPEPAVIDRMMRRAEEFMPTIRSLRVVHVRVGFRPASRDGLPMIGAVPGMPGVYVATGHEGVGITASTGTARLITDLVLGRASEIDRAAFDPGRFVTPCGTQAGV